MDAEDPAPLSALRAPQPPERRSRGVAAIAAACLAALLAAWIWTGGPASRPLEAPAARAEVDARAEPAELRAGRAAARSTETAERAAAPAEPPAGSASEAPAAEPDAVVVARIVDERGAPLGGVELRLEDVEPERVATSGEDGDVRVPAVLAELRARRTFVASAPGRVTRSRALDHLDPAVDGALYLGEIELGPGGDVAGRVVDPEGAPVEGAHVWATPPVGERTELERAVLRAWGVHGRWFGRGDRPRTSTDAEGRFQLEGVLAGEIALTARATGTEPFLAAVLSPLVVGRVPLLDAGDLHLGHPGPGDLVGGVVLDPDGVPVSGASLDAQSLDGSRLFPAYAVCGPDGRFRMVVLPGEEFLVRARHPERRFPDVRAPVRSGREDVELRFEVVRTFELRVVSDDGTPVGDGSLLIAPPDDGRGEHDWHRIVEGVAEVSLPEHDFSITVHGTGHHTRAIGPLEPDEVASGLTVRLERSGGLAGRATSGGQPVADAKVHVHVEPRGGSPQRLACGLVTFVEPNAWGWTATDAEGRFEVGLDRAGSYVVHASAAGVGHAATGPLAWSPGEELADLRLDLVEAGSIEGFVRTAPGVNARGIRVAATSGDGHFATTKTGAGGAYRLDDLATGPYLVRIVAEDTWGGVQQRRMLGRLEGTVAWDVEVRPGEEARHDLDATHRVPCLLEGTLSFGGLPASTWTADVDGKSIRLDANGHFLVRTDEPGFLWISLRDGAAPAGSLVWMSASLSLTPGRNAWTRDVPVGSVVLQELPPAGALPEDHPSVSWAPEYVLRWEGEDDLVWEHAFQESPDRRAVLDRVPAGELVLRYRGEGQTPENWLAWPVAAELHLREGEARTVRVDADQGAGGDAGD